MLWTFYVRELGRQRFAYPLTTRVKNYTEFCSIKSPHPSGRREITEASLGELVVRDNIRQTSAPCLQDAPLLNSELFGQVAKYVTSDMPETN